MSLSCCYDSDGVDFETVSHPTARKHYKCDECRQAIKPGDDYTRHFIVWDGMPETLITCERCSGLASALAELQFCHNLGELKSAYKQYLEEFAGAVKDDAGRMILPSGRTVDEQMARAWPESPQESPHDR